MKRFTIFFTSDKTSSFRVLSRAITLIFISLTFFASTVIVTYLPLSAYADTKSDLDNANKELEDLKKSQANLSSEYSKLNNELTEAGNKVSSVDEQIKSKQEEIDELNSQIDTLNASINDQYEAMKLRIKYMYENNSSDLLIETMLESGNMADFLVKSEYILNLSTYDRKQLDKLHEQVTSRNEKLDSLVSDKTELEGLKTELNSNMADLKSSIYKVQANLNETSTNISDVEAKCLEYEKKIQDEEIARQLAAIQAMQAGDEINYSGTKLDYTQTDLAMLAAIIECEAGNQSYEGKLAVASVIINRVLNPRFGDSISSVIYASGQFSPVASGRFAIVLARGASDECKAAALSALNGNLNTSALYFHVYRPGKDEGGTVIGDHVFY